MSSNFNWKNFFSLAENLSENHNDEASYRTAIGRYYYASFGTARNFILTNNLYRSKKSETIMNSNSGKVHQEARDIFLHFNKYREDSLGKEIATDLNHLRKSRNSADYNSVFDYEENSIDLCRSRANSIFRNLEKF